MNPLEDRMTPSMQSGRPSLSCEHCGERFRRKEHRDRHMSRHTGSKPFQCEMCSKTFSRSDTLLRHQNLHRNDTQGRGSGRRCNHACIPCAKLKQRCDGGLPCSRCCQKQSDCRYNSTKSPSSTPISPPEVDHRNSQIEHSVSGGSVSSESITVVGAQSSDSDSVSAQWHSTTSQAADYCYQSSSWPPRYVFSSSHQDNALSGEQNQPEPPDSTSMTTPKTWSAYSPWHHDNHNFCDWSVDNEFIFGQQGPPLFHFPFLNMFDSVEPLSGPPDSLKRAQGRLQGSTASDCLAAEDTSDRPAAEVSTPNVLEIDQVVSPSSKPTPSQPSESEVSDYPEFPSLQAEDLRVANAEMFGHVDSISMKALNGIHDFYVKQRRGKRNSSFIDVRIMHAFVELYFEYFDFQFPFLHPCRIEAEDTSWLLLLAVAAVGSQYSEISTVRGYSTVLTSLLGSATETSVLLHQSARINIAMVQGVFLRQVIFMFSGSMRDKTALQYDRNMLITLCRNALNQERHPRTGNNCGELVSNEQWLPWLCVEEEARLVCCIHILECLVLLYLDLPPLFILTDFLYKLPCQDELWHCRDAEIWKSTYESQSTRKPPNVDAFLSRISLLALYVDERNLQHQIRSSQRLRSSFDKIIKSQTHDWAQPLSNSNTMLPDVSMSTIPGLDETINSVAFKDAASTSLTRDQSRTDTLVHVLAILKNISLRTLYAATGWQTTATEMEKSMNLLKGLFKKKTDIGRRCLWHATCIFTATRNSNRIACYDTLALSVATCYIWSYIQAQAQPLASPESQNPEINGTSKKEHRNIVRLDRLFEKPAVERWLESGDCSDVHLTGVGLLKGLDSCDRFLGDINKTLLSQVAWHGLCQALANSFVQLGRGELPNLHLE